MNMPMNISHVRVELRAWSPKNANVSSALWGVRVTTVVTTARDKIRTKSGIDAKSQRIKHMAKSS